MDDIPLKYWDGDIPNNILWKDILSIFWKDIYKVTW